MVYALIPIPFVFNTIVSNPIFIPNDHTLQKLIVSLSFEDQTAVGKTQHLTGILQLIFDLKKCAQSDWPIQQSLGSQLLLKISATFIED